MAGHVKGTEGYADQAEALIPRWRLLCLHDKPQAVLELLPKQPGFVVDIGAGIGVDAAGLAEAGHRVVAIEPVAAFRQAGRKLHSSTAIEWVDDALPGLVAMQLRAGAFDLALLSAVWMHLDRDERVIGMKTVTKLVRPGGRVIMSLRHGPVPRGRRMFEVTADETIVLASDNGLSVVLNLTAESVQHDNRSNGVTWTHLVFDKLETF